MREYFRAAENRARTADELTEVELAASFSLLREAAILYMAGLLAVSPDAQVDEPLKASDVVGRFQTLQKTRNCPCSSEELARFLNLVSAEDPLAFDRLSADEASERAKSGRAIVAWLRDLNEPRSLRQIKMQRVFRIGLVAAVVLMLLIWGLSALVSSPNIALHKPVSTSSVYPGTNAPPNGLTDGVTSGTYGAHTNREEHPWAQIDLLDVYRINKVKIYNRGDGWYDEGLPMTLEFSENGVDFVEVDKRTASFGQWVPWMFNARKKKARYLRVVGNRGAYVALNEIEVTGKK